MIGFLRGNIISSSGQKVLIDVAGVGYELISTAALVSRLTEGQGAELLVHTDMQESSIRLFGFNDRTEKEVFLLLISVTGIGAKTAVDIISKIDKVELLNIIGREDVAALKQIKGIGGKTAERLVLELKDKVTKIVEINRMIQGSDKSIGNSAVMDETLQALVALGFSRKDSLAALEKIKGQVQSKTDTGEAVRQALAVI